MASTKPQPRISTTVTMGEVDFPTCIDPIATVPRIPSRSKVPTAPIFHITEIPIDDIDTLSSEKISPNTEPPRDTGKTAITILLAVVLLDSSTYGILLAYGVFQEYYHDKYADSAIASWIGVLSGGLPFLGAPAVTWCCQRYSFPRQYYIWLGFALCVLSLLASAFITTLPALVVTQGLTYGTGCLLVSIPELIILNTWFDKRRGVAYGIVFAGADLFGMAYTFLAMELLHRFTFQTTMLIFTGLTFALAGPAILLLRERTDDSTTPTPQQPSQNRRPSLSTNAPFSPSIDRKSTWPKTQPRKRFYQRGVFYLFTIINFLHSSAWYLPFIYLPSFVTQLGYTKQTAATVLAIGNFAMIIGDLGFGKLSDKLHVNILLIVTTGVSSASAFVLWGLVGSGSKDLGAVIAFMALFSCFGGGIVALWARMGTVFGEKDAQMVYSTLCFGRGAGGILSGPISQVLLKKETPKALQKLGKGPYGGIIMFVGMCMAGAAIMGIGAILALWWKKDRAHVTSEEADVRKESILYLQKE